MPPLKSPCIRRRIRAPGKPIRPESITRTNVSGWVTGGSADPALAGAQALLAEREAALAAYNQAQPEDPQAAARVDSRSQRLKAIAIDLGGDGIATTTLPDQVMDDWQSLATDGIARFDTDNDGFREATEWLSNNDAFLAIDRNEAWGS